MYYVYHIDHIPEALTAKHTNHAVYGGLAVFGESIEALTGIALTPEQIDSYINTDADEGHMSQLADEADQDQARIDAREALRTALQLILMAPDSREIRVTSQQGRTLHDDWLAAQPQTTGI
jgi:hypothetical protein